MNFNKLFAVLVAVFLTASLSSSAKKKVYNVVDFGAVSDTTVLSTSSVQAAIDKCTEKGGGVVFVPKGDYKIGTINLKSNVEFNVEQGATLWGSLNLADYSTTNTGAIEAPAFDKTLIFAEGAKNVKITGKGTFNGRGHRENFPIRLANKQLGDRPMMLRFIACQDVEFTDITFRDAGSWCCHLVDCDDMVIKGVTIDSHVNGNNDGFDIDGCKNVLVEDCYVRSGDDGLCPKSTTTRITENIVFRNCRVISNTAGFKCGTSSRGGFNNITVENCDFTGSRLCAIKLLMVDGGIMENITIDNIVADSTEGPIFIRLANRGRDYNKPTEQVYAKDAQPEGVPVGSVRNIKISNVKATVVSEDERRNGIMISGIPGHLLENIVLENIDISYPGGVKKGEYPTEVAEDIARYPERYFFGVLPSWGAYVRHAKNVEFKNVKMSVREADEREMFVFDNVEGFVEK